MPDRGADTEGGRRRPACREVACLFHDGQACGFEWIEPPVEEPLDRGRCRNVVLVEPDGYRVRMSALF